MSAPMSAPPQRLGTAPARTTRRWPRGARRAAGAAAAALVALAIAGCTQNHAAPVSSVPTASPAPPAAAPSAKPAPMRWADLPHALLAATDTVAPEQD
ncbi:hypothetical protein [Nocardiopsis coralliicola]